MEGRKESVQFDWVNCKENQKWICNRSYWIWQGIFSSKSPQYHWERRKCYNRCLECSKQQIWKKDIIKVENRYLEPDETNKLSLIAPHATINIIKDYKLAEKRKIQLPDYITGIFKCPNLRCVTIGENIKSVIEVIDKEKIILKCKYCGRILSIDELIF